MKENYSNTQALYSEKKERKKCVRYRGLILKQWVLKGKC
jgi:hypothetical protein